MIRLTFPIIFILISIGLFFIYIDPVYSDIQLKISERNEFNNALDKSRELREVRDRLLSLYNTFSTNDLDNLKKLLPDNVDNVRLILDIDYIASTYGMRIKNVTINKKDNREVGVIGPSNKLFESVKLSFSVVSSYDNFIQFVRNIEKSLRVVDITEVSLIQQGDEINNLTYEYRIGLETYWLK
ncbi:hypothetical protein COT82_00085 [Candidatus Campbellbacteria bacterium CG10_big_fil_rev_8_21_14_0_10_35_52]|uniref:Pilus assembly protein PilO n=1 Tax=Candidatus Campbellbacteria bacterium CG10_big_fil_rev_8_21_14_0_10_35_52 TaxID=1974527 RepID=A0A2M6WW45_9BACT|nr:MAG: hypothetical protein COT82_00085 [Candidatus Campbellbacteria bacterium CG10_big_fil_rev_8_21_14_0_10_35_52]